MKRNKLLRIFILMTAVVMLCPVINASAISFTPVIYDEEGDEQEVKLYSKAAYMINLDSGEVLIDTNADEERTPASLTKIMTAVVLLDHFKGDEEKMKKTYWSANTEAFDELYNLGASTADIQPNEKVSAYDLLAALMIPSACEAANIIAVNIGGTIDKFTDIMNKKAQELGMNHSSFSNAHGLFSQQNYSSCHDMATLCKYALESYPVFKDIVGMSSYKMESTDMHPNGTEIVNTNEMLNSTSNYFYSYCKGIKTGTLDSAGRCLASYAVNDGVSYLIVTMGAPMEKREEDYAKGQEDPTSIFAADEVYYNILDHLHLYNWAYTMLKSTDFINANSEVRDVSVAYGSNCDYANLKPAHGFNRMWPSNISIDDVKKKVTVKQNIVAPIEVGDVLGKMELIYKGKVIAEIDLVSTTKVERSHMREQAKIAGSYFTSNVFKVTVFIIVLGILIYAAINFVRSQKKYLK